MTIYIYLTIFSIIVYFLIYNFRKKISFFFKVNDIPNEKRKIHKHPIPKTASYSLVITLFLILIINQFLNIFKPEINYVIIPTLLFFILGFIDDKFNLKAITKIIASSIIILIIINLYPQLLISKFYIFSFDIFFNLNFFSQVFTMLCIMCLINSLNLSDGINGLATGLVFFWLIYITIIYKSTLNENIYLIFIILVNLILIFNYNLKNKHFLGDAGSLMLSAFVAFFIIYLHNQKINDPNHINSAETIFILFFIPILDMLRLFFVRLIKKTNPGVGDNNHLHHHLIKKFSLIISLFIYFLLVNVPVLLSIFTKLNKFFIVLLVILTYIILFNYLKKNEIIK
jgi:UDP-GlcNAc:undecaprenyl-phosphate/decaprenyl-phosphate GlcNAc-1-phosphate transferase